MGFIPNIRASIESGAATRTLLDDLRKEHSRLFLLPGKYALIFPYEAAFRHVAEGREGLPTLFIATQTKDVERRIRRLGILPKTAQQEPVDSVQGELDFLKTLYTSLANTINQNDDETMAFWKHEIESFRSDHVDAWMPALMRRIDEETKSPVYHSLSELAIAALRITALPKGTE